VARFALLLLLVASCSGPSSTAPLVRATASPTVGATGSPTTDAAIVWKSDAILDFPNSLVGDLELIDGNLITLTGDNTTITGTQMVAIDPTSGRTSWTDRTLTGLVPPGDRSFHYAHYLRDGNDLIALVTDGTQGRSAVIRFSVPQRRLLWQFAVNEVLVPESLAVHNSVTCFAGIGANPQLARSVTCLDPNGRRLWTSNLIQGESISSDTEIEIAASRVMVIAAFETEPGRATISVLDLHTGALAGAPFQVDATFGGIAMRHLAVWKQDKVAVFLTGGIAVIDLSSPQPTPQLVISLAGQFPRAPQLAVAGSTAYVMYDLPYPNGGDQPSADVVAAFNLDTATTLWAKTDPAGLIFERMRPMRVQGSSVLYGDHDGGVWVLAAATGAVQRHLVPQQSPVIFLDRVAPLVYGGWLIVSENLGPGPTDYRLAAIQEPIQAAA
jgi:outer membrane protein assembly factor BamB